MEHITALPFSPFVDPEQVDHDNRFVLDPNAFFAAIKAASDHWPLLEWPVWSTRDDPPPSFLTNPSSNYMEALGQELRPILSAIGRR